MKISTRSVSTTMAYYTDVGLVDIKGNPVSAFAAITQILVDDSVTTIPAGAFSGCTSLEHLTLPMQADKPLGFYFESSPTARVTNVCVPPTLRTVIVSSGELAPRAFASAEVSSIIIRPKISHIPEFAFDACCKLEEIVLPDSVTTIEQRAFANCRRLVRIDLPKSLVTIASDAFMCCGLETLKCPDTLTTIADTAFSYCTKLSSVELSKNLCNLGAKAFTLCTSLVQIEIPASLKAISSEAFSFCEGLTKVIFNEGLLSIGCNAFAFCTSLRTVTIPDTVIEIGYEAFQQCCTLAKVSLGKSVKTIEDFAFSETDLTSITVPASVTSVDLGSFCGCPNLSLIRFAHSDLSEYPLIFQSFSEAFDMLQFVWEGIVIRQSVAVSLDLLATTCEFPEGVTAICEGFAQRACYLASVKFPKSLTRIGAKAFDYCISLEEVDLHDCTQLRAIDEEAFSRCYSLEKVTAPPQNIDVSPTAFKYCYSIGEEL